MRLNEDGEYQESEDWYEEDTEPMNILYETDEDRQDDDLERDVVGRIKKVQRKRDFLNKYEPEESGLL